jgi:hypothetical protein
MLVLVIYVLYSFFALPFAGFLLSLAVGLMSYGGLESFEMSVSLMIISGVMYSLISKQTIREPTSKGREGFADLVDPLQISKRVKEIRKEIPKGVYASSFAEGFADADTDSNSDEKEKKAMVAATEAASKPASATGSGEAGSGIAPASLETSGFKGSAGKDNGEFMGDNYGYDSDRTQTSRKITVSVSEKRLGEETNVRSTSGKLRPP